MDFERVAKATETLDIAFEISRILDTGLDRKTVAILIALCENGVNPEVIIAIATYRPVATVQCVEGVYHAILLQSCTATLISCIRPPPPGRAPSLQLARSRAAMTPKGCTYARAGARYRGQGALQGGGEPEGSPGGRHQRLRANSREPTHMLRNTCRSSDISALPS